MSVRFRDRVRVVVRRILGLGAAFYAADEVVPPSPDLTPGPPTGVPGGHPGKPPKPAKRPFLYYPYVQDVPELVTVYPFTFAKPKSALAMVIQEPELPSAPIFAKPLPFEITELLQRPKPEVEKLKTQARAARRRIQTDGVNDMNLRILLLLDY